MRHLRKWWALWVTLGSCITVTIGVSLGAPLRPWEQIVWVWTVMTWCLNWATVRHTAEKLRRQNELMIQQAMRQFDSRWN